MSRRPWADRSTAESRGYGTEHRRLRRQWKPKVDAGTVECWRCHHPIDPGGAWELGHDDDDRTLYRGPEHVTCNQDAGRAQGAQNRPNISRPPERHPGLL